MVKKSLLIPACFAILALTDLSFAQTDSNGNEIRLEKTRSNVEVTQLFENSLIQDASVTSSKATLVTPWFGVGAFGQFAEGKRRQDPFSANITTAGAVGERDTFKKEEGDTNIVGVFGGGKTIVNDSFIDLVIKYGDFKGSTDIGIDELGAQSEEGHFFGGKISLLDIVSDFGLFVGYRLIDKNEKSNYGNVSSEDITDEQLSMRVRVPVIKSLISLVPNFTIKNEESSAIYFGVTSKDILSIPRDVKSTKYLAGIDAIMYEDFLKKAYVKLGGGLINGSTRHEYESPDVNGFFANIEYGFGNSGEGNFIESSKTLFIRYSEQDSRSDKAQFDSFDPSTGIPIEILFDEKRSQKEISVGYKGKLFDCNIEYTNAQKSGSTIVRIPLMGNMEKPIGNAHLREEVLSVYGARKIGDDLELNAGYTRGLDEEAKEAFSLGAIIKF